MKKLVQYIFKKLGIIIISEKNNLFINMNLTDPFNIQYGLFLNKSGLIIFDVGANYGQTALEYVSRFQNCSIYSFEPFYESFKVLKTNVKEYPNVQIYNLAFGDTIGKINFNSNTVSATNSILETDEHASSVWGNNLLDTIEKTEVPITTIDNFVYEQKISEIDILKIDVQGYEFNVIEGARHLILRNGVKVIYMEIIILPTYQKQKSLDEILALMRSNNFSLYNLYNFSYDSFGSLRQVDAIFINNNYKGTLFPRADIFGNSQC